MRRMVVMTVVVAGVLALVVGALTALPEVRGSRASSGISLNSPWWTSIQIQNQGIVTASTMIEYYDLNGTLVEATVFSISPGATQVIWPLPVPDGFAGSAVVSSSEPVVAVVNEVGSGVFGSHNGVNESATPVYLPLIMRGNYGWDTWFAVQNAMTDTADVTLRFYDMSGALVETITDTIPALASRYYDQSDDAFSGLGSIFVGSAVVESSQPVAVAVNESSASTLLTYNGFVSGSTTAYLPLVMKDNYTWSTSHQVQNLGGSPAVVRIEYYAKGETSPTLVTTDTITTSLAYWPPPAGLPSGFVGSAVLYSTNAQDIVAIVNEVVSPGVQGMSYSGFSGGTPKVSLPLIMKDNYGWHTSIQVQNLGAITATVDVNYYAKGSSTPTHTDLGVEIGPSAVKVFWPLPAGVPDGFVGSATLESTNSQPLVAVVNEVCTACTGESSAAYNGFNE